MRIKKRLLDRASRCANSRLAVIIPRRGRGLGKRRFSRGLHPPPSVIENISSTVQKR